MNLKLSDNNLNMDTKNGMIRNADTENVSGKYEELQNDDWMNQFEETPYVSPVKEPKKKSAKELLAAVFAVIMFVGIAVWCLVSGTNAMFLAPVHPMEEAFTNLAEGEVYEGSITCISPEVGELKHTINFIPAGTEHFYLMVSEDGTTVIPIRASKQWDTLYAGGDWMDVSLQERGIVREMDYKVKNELMSSLVTAFEAEGIQIEKTYYLDLNANKMGGLQIFAGVALILCIIYFVAISKRLEDNGNTFKTAIAGVMLVLGFVSLAVIIYLLNMVGL